MNAKLSRGTTLFAIFASLLIVSVAPVTAAGDNLVIASEHTTDTDFQNATELTNVSVEGTGTSAAVSLDDGDVPIETVEDGDISEYAGDTGSLSASTSNAYSGTYSLSVDGGGSNTLAVNTTTQYSAGTDWSYRDYLPGPGTHISGLAFALQSTNGHASNSGYYATVSSQENEIEIWRLDSGSQTNLDTTAVSIPNGEHLKIEVSHQSDGTITVDVYDQSGSFVGSSTTTDTNYSSGYIGWYGYEEHFVDDLVNDGVASSSGTYISPVHDVSDPAEGRVDVTLSNATADIVWQANTSGTWSNVTSTTVSTSGTKTADISSTSADEWRVQVDFDKTGENPTAAVSRDAVYLESSAPSINNTTLSPNSTSTTVSSLPITLSANVSDSDFAEAGGDTLTAEWYVDGSKRGETTINSNTTAEYTLSNIDAGEHTWHVEVTDNYNNTVVSDTASFVTPSQLELYYESNQTRINETNTTFEVRFFETGETSSVVELPVDNGTVNMTGLPADKNFVVTVDGNDSQFVYRRVFIDSLYETSRVYLPTDQANLTQVVYELQDPTGKFPPSDTVLLIERPMNINGTVQYQRISGDIFGASGRFPTYLQSGTRYRLKVRHLETGEERVLGFYSTYEDTVEPLKIARIQPEPDTSPGGVVYGGLTEGQLAVRYQGDNASVEYRVINASGGVVVPNTSVNGDFAHVYNVTTSGSNTYTVEYTIDYVDGGVISDSFSDSTVGQIATRFAIDPQVLSLLSWAAIIATMGLLVLANVRLAGAGGVAVASALTIIGTVAIPAPILGVAGVISALAIFGGNR